MSTFLLLGLPENNKPVEIGGPSRGKGPQASNAALKSAKEQKTIALCDYYTLDSEEDTNERKSQYAQRKKQKNPEKRR